MTEIKKPKKPLFSLMAILAFMLVIIYALSNDGFQDLHIGATNGEWAAMAIAENNRFLYDSIDDLFNSSIVIRAEVINERSEVISFGDSVQTHHLYALHQIRVLEVYRSSLEIDDIIEIRQLKQFEGLPRWQRLLFMHPLRATISDSSLVNLVWVPISVGDELIMFLTREVRSGELPPTWEFIDGERRDIPGAFIEVDGERTRHPDFTIRPILWIHYTFVSPIQGVFFYTPHELRNNCDNWTFEPINPHNNLALTLADLQRLRDDST
ncbi:MAG: hypothetical protein FWC91_14190 [Defluviitaleaceae bacterium]|nr:hypothetical protein [Defluviitaleaceae bacterium]